MEKIAASLSLSPETIKEYITKLKKKGLLKRTGIGKLLDKKKVRVKKADGCSAAMIYWLRLS